MGGGYNNFMSKKGFHPGSQANQTKIRRAEEEAAAKKKLEEDRIAQYLKEQELLDQKSLVSKESKDKLSLSFMYNPPPGTSGIKKDGVKQESNSGEPMKWNRTTSFKTTSVKIEKKPRRDSSSSSDNEINLTWSRPEPKVKKKVKTEK